MDIHPSNLAENFNSHEGWRSSTIRASAKSLIPVGKPKKISAKELKALPEIQSLRNDDTKIFKTSSSAMKTSEERIDEQLIEVPQIHQEILLKHIPVPQIVQKKIHEHVQVEELFTVERNIPIPLKITSTNEYQIPALVSRVRKVKFRVYVPRFVEALVAVELVPGDMQFKMSQLNQQVSQLANMKEAASLCELESLAVKAQDLSLDEFLSSISLDEAFKKAWGEGKLNSVLDTTYIAD